MPIRKTKQINLIPQSEFDTSPLGRILKWALSTFRVMVIVTELIVMSAFLSRFWLDAKNSDLNDEINVNKAQVLAYSDIESKLRMYQKKINISKSLYSQKKISDMMNTITKLIPNEVSFVSIAVNGNQLEIKATASSEQAVAQFLVNLNDYKDLKDVNLTQIGSSVENIGQTVFTVAGEIK